MYKKRQNGRPSTAPHSIICINKRVLRKETPMKNTREEVLCKMGIFLNNIFKNLNSTGSWSNDYGFSQ
jgi:hypothetical protein